MTFTLDSFLGDYKPRQVPVPVATRRDLARTLDDLRHQLAQVDADGEQGLLAARLLAARRRLIRTEADDATTNAPNNAPTVRAEVEELEAELAALDVRLEAERAPIREEGARVEAEVRESEREWVFEEIPRTELSDMRAEHPPKDEDRKAGADVDYASFEAAVMARACVEPPGVETRDDAERIAKVLGGDVYQQLVAAAFEAQKGFDSSSFSLGSARAHRPSTS